ncbi:MAG: ABC transporter ATP-binding protein [Peptostreptococcaceae bacterium]|nr:ABC transporter ATP-binding protein [Peptostreptococcaceae bacterium]
MKEEKEEQMKRKSLMQWILQFASSDRTRYVKSMVFALCGVICRMMPYYLTARIVQLFLQGEKIFSAYFPLFIGTALFWTLGIIFHSVSTSNSHEATFALLANVRKQICAKLLRVPLGDVITIPSGELKNIIVERVDSIETTLAHIVPEFTANITAPILMFIYLLTINWKLALASLITLPLGIFLMSLMMKDQEKWWKDCIQKTKILNDTAVEYINGIEVIKVFGKTDSSYEKFEKAAKDGANAYIDWMRASIFYFSSGLAIVPATLLAVLPIGGFMYLHGNIEASDLIMVIILSMGLITPLITVMAYNDDIARATVIFEEVGSLLEMREMHRPESTNDMPQGHSLELCNVHFGYQKDKEILHGVDMTIVPGTVNAFVGPSGGGKTTIARLIASLWDVDEGSISMGGVDVKKIALSDHNEKIAYVSQDNYLFNTSVLENIRMGRKGATDAEVIETAKRCGCHDFIIGLEKGYDTIVGDAGGHLSGGERQRISIARAMLKDAPVIILDEATAYTDPENEAIIQRSIASMIDGKTLIVIAHRLSTITDADRIFVIKNGKVDSQGTHEELLSMNGLYKKMWEAHMAVKDSDLSEITA